MHYLLWSSSLLLVIINNISSLSSSVAYSRMNNFAVDLYDMYLFLSLLSRFHCLTRLLLYSLSASFWFSFFFSSFSIYKGINNPQNYPKFPEKKNFIYYIYYTRIQNRIVHSSIIGHLHHHHLTLGIEKGKSKIAFFSFKGFLNF